MACLTSATMNTQWNGRRSPRLRVRGQSPKVAMAELLTACKATPAWEGEQLEVSRGITLTSAPVSTRNRRPLVRFVTKNRRLELPRPVTLVAVNGWPGRFPTRHKAGCTCGLGCQIVYGTNTSSIQVCRLGEDWSRGSESWSGNGWRLAALKRCCVIAPLLPAIFPLPESGVWR